MSDIQVLEPNVDQAPGILSTTEASVNKALSRRTGDAIPRLSLGRPSVLGGTILVGTDDPSGQSHVLIALDVEAMEKARKDPIVGFTSIAQQIRDVRWLSNTTAVCATGKGTMLLYNVAAADREIKLNNTINQVHTDSIRELATQEGQAGLVASGGFEGTLCISSFVDPQNVSLMNKATMAGKVIGSVKWPSFNSNVCVSCTTDDGQYAMFDTRAEMVAPAVQADTDKADLFTHARYSDHHLLLGYGDGEMKQLDMRKPAEIVLSVLDPYVEGIGGIEFNSKTQAFILFRLACQQRARLAVVTETACNHALSHVLSGTDGIINEGGYSVSGVFLDDDTTVTSNTEGIVRISVQGFSDL